MLQVYPKLDNLVEQNCVLYKHIYQPLIITNCAGTYLQIDPHNYIDGRMT
jgi:hypothetical protein